MDKNKKSSPGANPVSQACFFLVLLPSGIAMGVFLIGAIIQMTGMIYWDGLNTVLIVNGIFFVCLAVIAYMTWRVSRKKYRAFKMQQEHSRIERLIEKQSTENEELELRETTEENHFPQNQQNSL